MKRFFRFALPLATLFAPIAARAQSRGLLTGISSACAEQGDCQIPDFFIVGNNVSRLILGLSGSFMLLMVIIGGFFWLTAAGNTERIEKGKKILSGSVIGLIIVFAAYTIIQFVVYGVACPKDKPCPYVNEVFQRPFGGGTNK